jgi:tetratricopeptide (TPR) repeat protein
MKDARKDQPAKLQAGHEAADVGRRDELAPQKEPRYAPVSPGLEKKMRAPQAVAEDEGGRGRVVGGVAGSQGSGGDAFERPASKAVQRQDSKAAPSAAEPAAPRVASRAAQEPAVKNEAVARAMSPTPAAAEQASPSVAERPAMQAIASRPQAQAAAVAKTASGPPPAQSAEQLEKLAQEARHRGDYPTAASLYRSAADLRRADAVESPAAAWDLAHAVECFAADGRFDDARRLRDELSRLYPSQSTAFAAAGRALRSVDGAAPAPAAKAKKATSEDSAVPGD